MRAGPITEIDDDEPDEDGDLHDDVRVARFYGALGRAADVASLAVWSAMKHGGAMELWEERAA